jgi:ATP-binding cassette subfamily B protein
MNSSQDAPQQSAGRSPRTPVLLLGAGMAGVACTVTLALSAALGTFAVPVAIQQILDSGRYAVRADFTVVSAVALAAATVMCVSALSAYWLTMRLTRRTETILDEVRTEAFQRLMTDTSESTTPRFAVAQRITDDIDRVSQFVRWGGPELLVNLGKMTIAVVVMALYSWELTTLAVLVVVVPALGRRRLRQYVMGGFLAVRKLSIDVHSGITDLVAKGRQAAGAEELAAIQRQIEGVAARRRQHQLRIARAETVAMASGEIAVGAGVAVVIVAGTAMGVAGKETLGQLTAFVLVMVFAITPAQFVIGSLADGQLALARWRHLKRVCFGERPPAGVRGN